MWHSPKVSRSLRCLKEPRYVRNPAKADILPWATELAPDGEFIWVRGGLDERHVKQYHLPVSIEVATTGLIDSDAIQEQVQAGFQHGELKRIE